MQATRDQKRIKQLEQIIEGLKTERSGLKAEAAKLAAVQERVVAAERDAGEAREATTQAQARIHEAELASEAMRRERNEAQNAARMLATKVEGLTALLAEATAQLAAATAREAAVAEAEKRCALEENSVKKLRQRIAVLRTQLEEAQRVAGLRGATKGTSIVESDLRREVEFWKTKLRKIVQIVTAFGFRATVPQGGGLEDLTALMPPSKPPVEQKTEEHAEVA